MTDSRHPQNFRNGPTNGGTVTIYPAVIAVLFSGNEK
jgi:hypothetical protein